MKKMSASKPASGVNVVSASKKAIATIIGRKPTAVAAASAPVLSKKTVSKLSTLPTPTTSKLGLDEAVVNIKNGDSQATLTPTKTAATATTTTTRVKPLTESLLIHSPPRAARLGTAAAAASTAVATTAVTPKGSQRHVAYTARASSAEVALPPGVTTPSKPPPMSDDDAPPTGRTEEASFTDKYCLSDKDNLCDETLALYSPIGQTMTTTIDTDGGDAAIFDSPTKYDLKRELYSLRSSQCLDRQRIDKLTKLLEVETMKSADAQSRIVELTIALSSKDRDMDDMKGLLSISTQQLLVNGDGNATATTAATAASVNSEDGGVLLSRYQTAVVNMDKELNQLKHQLVFIHKRSIADRRMIEQLKEQLSNEGNKNQQLLAKVEELSKGKEAMMKLVKVKDSLMARYHSLAGVQDDRPANRGDANDYSLVTLSNAKECMEVGRHRNAFQKSDATGVLLGEESMKRLKATNVVLMGDLQKALSEKRSVCTLLQEKDYCIEDYASALRQKELELSKAMQVILELQRKVPTSTTTSTTTIAEQDCSTADN